MKKIKWHCIYWLLYSACALVIDFSASRANNFFELSSNFNLIRELIVLLIEIFIFYSFLFALIKYDSKNWLSIFKSLCLFIFSFSLTTILNYGRGIIANYYGVIILKNYKELILDSIEFYIQFSFYSIGYFYSMRYVHKQQEVREVEYANMLISKDSEILLAENSHLQKKLLQSENDFLRAQINPHFLYNCLNFFYSKTFVPQPEIAESILLLSQIMRYSLADFSITHGLAYLTDELEHIENLIKINGSRFDHKLQIKFKLEGLASGKKITPMLLMTLVENIFKHGNLQDISSPATITCTIDESNNTIIFLTSNIKNRLTQELSSGLGLINIEHRLKLLYNDNFKLHTINTPTLFMVELVMPYFN